MYPLKAILVGCTPETGALARGELAAAMAQIETECAGAAELAAYERSAIDRPERWTSDWGGAGLNEKRRLYVIQLKTAEELRDLRWLSDNLAGHPVLALVDEANEPFPVIDALRV